MKVTVHRDFIGVEIPVGFIKFLLCYETPTIVELLPARKIIFSPLKWEWQEYQVLIADNTHLMLKSKEV